MATHYDEPIVISEDAARGGVTGHNVRYVLVYGMTGVVAAFAAVAIYLGYDRLQARLIEGMSQSPSEMLRAFAPYAAGALLGAIAAALLLGLWNMAAGRSENASQSWMRARVVCQFALILAILTMVYTSAA